MKTNSILREIRKTREMLSEESGGDLDKLFDVIRRQEIASAKRGEKYASPPPKSAMLREAPVEYRSNPAK